MFHGNETVIFAVRCAPTLAKRATELARQRGIGRSRLVIRLLERELAGAIDQPTDPAKEEVNAAKQI